MTAVKLEGLVKSFRKQQREERRAYVVVMRQEVPDEVVARFLQFAPETGNRDESASRAAAPHSGPLFRARALLHEWYLRDCDEWLADPDSTVLPDFDSKGLSPVRADESFEVYEVPPEATEGP